nr:MAG TPA: hypothetical protein [Caudoviricetes sp.]
MKFVAIKENFKQRGGRMLNLPEFKVIKKSANKT